jgi:plastocyanin
MSDTKSKKGNPVKKGAATPPAAAPAAKDNTALLRWSVVVAISVIALFGSYTFAVAQGQGAKSGTPAPLATPTAQAAVAPQGAGTSTAGAAGGSGCACCGTATAGPATTKQADVSGAVQKISVDVSKGYYDPSTIELKAGVPAEITFSQSSGCTGVVESTALGFSQDLTQGPATVKLPALAAGTYGFNCGMQMVFGSIVVK